MKRIRPINVAFSGMAVRFQCQLLASCLLLMLATDTTAQAKLQHLIPFSTQNSLVLEADFTHKPSPAETFTITIADLQGNTVIVAKDLQAKSAESMDNRLRFELNDLPVKSWSPVSPQLYIVKLNAGDMGIAEIRTGFRTIKSDHGQIWLNGKPVFLRGIAINPPGRGIPDTVEKSRRFARDYVRYMKSLHVNIIRIPNDTTWYNVCDEEGMLVFGGNYSALVAGERPPANYEKGINWYKETAFSDIATHPSLVIYALTNEVPFQGPIAGEWERFLTYAHKRLQSWDSTRLYIGNAGYGYGKSGDICDLHRYWGWYYCSPFTFLYARDNKYIIPFDKPVQPVTFSECVGNYTGPGGQYNLTPGHKNPGSQLNWTGHAAWDQQRRLANEHQCFTFAQATELLRRLRSQNSELSGVFPFTILFYNWNNVERFIDMDPKPVALQARISYQPVLLSWENWTSQCYAGSSVHPIVHVVNDADDGTDLDGAVLIYQIRDKAEQVLTTDSLLLPRIPYYKSWQQRLQIRIPDNIPAATYYLEGRIEKKGKLISINKSTLYIGHPPVTYPTRPVLLIDANGSTEAAFRKLHLPYKILDKSQKPGVQDLLVIGENSADANMPVSEASLRAFIRNGGRILCLRQDSVHFARLNSWLPVPMKNIQTLLDDPVYPPAPRPSRNGYYVNPERQDHPLFSGIGREQLKVWSDYTGWNETKPGFPAIYPVTDGFVPVNKSDMEAIAVLADYGVALEGMAIAELFTGKGSVLLSGMDCSRRTGLDPVADRLLVNMIRYMQSAEDHNRYPFINTSIEWGNYASEKGILTGINSGLMLNAVPKVPENNRSSLRLSRDGNLFLGAHGGFNTRPGVQYLPYGRRMYGPYYLRGFGNIPEPLDTNKNIGKGVFYCEVPASSQHIRTLVWNPADVPLQVSMKVNNLAPVSMLIPAGKRTYIAGRVNAPEVKVEWEGDRRLVLLETSFY